MKNVVIFAGSVVGSPLAIARGIRRQLNGDVYVICFNSKYASVYCTSRFVTDSIDFFAADDDSLFIQFSDWCERLNFTEKPVLYSTTDHGCLFVNRFRSWFENNFELTLPNSNIIDVYNLKGVAEQEAQRNGLLIPRTKKINSRDDIDEVIRSFRFPVIVKPDSFQVRSKLGFKVMIFEDRKKFQLSINQILEDESVVCQEYIKGGDEKSHYYLFYRDQHGKFYENIGVKALQSPPMHGIMAIGASKFNAKISEISQKFLNRIDYVGIGGIEYKEFNDQFYFIEMSTRPEGFFLISEVSGVPLSIISYLKTGRYPMNVEAKQVDNVKYVDLFALILARVYQQKLGLLLKDLLLFPFEMKTYFNLFKWNDFFPFIIKSLSVLRKH